MSEYVIRMRNLIGHAPLMMVGASVIIFNEARQVLMLRRVDNDSWCFPGGALDLDERVEETARREVQEETGLHLNDLILFGVYSGEDVHNVYPNGN